MNGTLALRPTDMFDDLGLGLTRLAENATNWLWGLVFQEDDAAPSDSGSPLDGLTLDDDARNFLASHDVSSSGEEPPKDEPEGDEPKADEPKPDEPEDQGDAGDGEPEPKEPESDDSKADEPESDEPEADEPKEDEPAADKPDEPVASPKDGEVAATLASGATVQLSQNIVDSVANAMDAANGDSEKFIRAIAKEANFDLDTLAVANAERPGTLDRIELIGQWLQRRGYTPEDLQDAKNIEDNDVFDAESWADIQLIKRDGEISAFDGEQASKQKAGEAAAAKEIADCDAEAGKAITSDKTFSGLQPADQKVASDVVNQLTRMGFYGGETAKAAAEQSAKLIGGLLRNNRVTESMSRRSSRKAIPGQAGAASKHTSIKLVPATPHSDAWRERASDLFRQVDRTGTLPDDIAGNG